MDTTLLMPTPTTICQTITQSVIQQALILHSSLAMEQMKLL